MKDVTYSHLTGKKLSAIEISELFQLLHKLLYRKSTRKPTVLTVG